MKKWFQGKGLWQQKKHGGQEGEDMERVEERKLLKKEKLLEEEKESSYQKILNFVFLILK